MKPLIQIQFQSETPKQVYSIFIDSLKDSIRSDFQDSEKLEEIRLELLEQLAIVEHLQYSNQRKGAL